MVKSSRHLVVLTGAGISTSAGIPDFRGPRGIWTLEEKAKKRKAEQSKDDGGQESVKGNNRTKGQKRKRGTKDDKDGGNEAVEAPPKIDFSEAKPTLTHRALRKMVELDLLKFVVTQNVDGLHKRSGMSRDHHAVLHGCVFSETCEDCRTEHFRDFDVGGMSFQRTGRRCEVCNGNLVDSLLDWEDELPEFDLERAQLHCTQADLVLCLGTSLRIEPAGGLPTKAEKFVIINLQETPYDKMAAMIVKAPVDKVMDELLTQLGYADWDSEPEKIKIERLWERPPPPPDDDDSDS